MEWLDVVLAAAALLLAWGTARLFTPRFREAALRFGIVDRPDGRLKTQREPVAYLGGLAVALGVLVALSVTFSFDQNLLAMLLGGSIVLVLGLVDDLGSLSPRTKLAGQLLAALVLVKGGVRIQLVYLPDWVEYPLTLLWIMGVTNAFNLIDVMDGLSAGVGAVAALFLGGVALAGGLKSTAFLAFALAGALWGFRRYNVSPAKIYLGDTGSLYAGFLLAAIAIANEYTRVHPLGAVAPVVILGVPIFDMLFVMYVRWRRGMPVMKGSPDHFALRLRKWRLSTTATARVSVAAAAVCGTTGLLVVVLPPAWAAATLGAASVAALLLAAWLKRIDMTM
ncbi:MAG TPA: MraY family glycosyltransferase [Acidobacteriota bacterium]|nr:MraY family glycosyltransferase [Acidobacteriota bacterium]